MEEDSFVVDKKNGEIIAEIDKGMVINVRTNEQAKNDKFYSPDFTIPKKFVKVMVDEKDIAKMLIGNPTTYVVLGIIKSYLVPNQNYLMKDGKKYKPIYLAREIGISAQAASRHFKILEKANLISECEIKSGKVWTMNPYYYMAGTTVPKREVDLYNKKR